MLETIPDFLQTYGLYLGGIAVLCAVMSYYSEKFFGNMKKGLLVFAVIFALIAGYELFTGNDIFSLPGRVDKKLSEQPTDAETGRRYYKSHKERFGDAMPDND